MATLASLRILLGLDSGDVSKGAARVKSELTDVQKRANLTRDALKGVAAGFGLGAGLGAFQVANRVVSEFTDLIGNAVNGVIAEEAGLARLTQSLNANVAGWDGNTAAIERTIEARMALGFADDEQRDSLARAVAATRDVNSALALQATAMDLARFKGISLADATDALIKVEAGQFRALKALGIELRDGATQTEALAAVQAVAAGQADVFASKTQGAMAAAGIAFNELIEEGVKPLIPLLGDIAEGAVDAIKEIKTLAADAGSIFADLNTQLQPFADIINWIEEHTSGAGAGINQLATDSFNFSVAGAAASAATTLWLDKIRILGNQLADGTITQDAYNAEVAVADAAYRDALTGASDLQKGLGDQRSELDRGTAAWQGNRDSAIAATASIREAGEGAARTAIAARDMGDGSREAGEGVRVLAADLRALIAEAAAAPAIFRTAQDAFEAFGTNAPLTSTGQQQLADVFLDKQVAASELAERQAREAERAANEAAAEAKRRAAEAKRIAEEAARQAERDAADARRAKEEEWRAAQEVADRYFDRVHKGNLDAIDDIRDRRNAELDAANAAIQGPVDAERARLEAIRDAERESGLRGAVAAAETPADLLAAQRDLQRFLEDERVEFMQGQADASIALNEAARENANAAADMAQAAEALRDIAARERFDPRVTRSADGSVARLDVADFLSDAPITVNVYIDGERVTEVVDRRLNTRRTNISPTSVSTGSAR